MMNWRKIDDFYVSFTARVAYVCTKTMREKVAWQARWNNIIKNGGLEWLNLHEIISYRPYSVMLGHPDLAWPSPLVDQTNAKKPTVEGCIAYSSFFRVHCRAIGNSSASVFKAVPFMNPVIELLLVVRDTLLFPLCSSAAYPYGSVCSSLGLPRLCPGPFDIEASFLTVQTRTHAHTHTHDTLWHMTQSQKGE